MNSANLDGFACLDIRSVIFATAIVTLVIALGMSAVARLHPEIKGTRYWATGCALQSIGWLLFDLRGHAPAFLTLYLGSLLPVASVGYFYATFLDFKGERPRAALLGSVLSATAALLFLFWAVTPNLLARIAVASLGAAALILLCVHALVAPSGGKEPSHGQRTTAIILAAGGILLLMRGILALFGVEMMSDPMQRAVFNRLMYLGINGTSVLVTFGYLAMCHDRFRDEALHLATTDSLTGALNRRAMETVLAEETQRAIRTRQPLSVLLLDMDHFKSVNDTYGHSVGDVVLRKAAEALGGQLRSFDRIARWGGEEFLVALPGTGPCDAAAIAERLRGEIRDCLVFSDRAGGTVVPLSVSIGVAGRHAGDSDFDDLLRRADDALYASKRAGRDCVTSSAVVAPGVAVSTHAGGASRDTMTV